MTHAVRTRMWHVLQNWWATLQKGAVVIVWHSQLRIERLDALLTVWWVKAGEDLHALDRVLKIQEQRVRLLGIEPPKHVRYSGSGSTGNAGGGLNLSPPPAHHGGHTAGIGLR